MNSQDPKKELLKKNALAFHRFPIPGKISVEPTKQVRDQNELALAYTPGVACACQEIHANPEDAYTYTTKGNLVAVISNGTAVLGLGNIGAQASKPVMEGKGVLFKKFAGINVFDLEINELDPDKLCDIIASLEPTFGGINLEDIRAPECFYIERKLRERMNIPVFHDDQHGTAVIVGAAILNALKVVGKDIKDCKMVVSGAGAGALGCLELLVDLGFPLKNIWVTDIKGVVYKGRKELMDPDKEIYAQDTSARTLMDVIPDADIFLGLSAGNILKPEMVLKMAKNPIIFAMANPIPEILQHVMTLLSVQVALITQIRSIIPCVSRICLEVLWIAGLKRSIVKWNWQQFVPLPAWLKWNVLLKLRQCTVKNTLSVVITCCHSSSIPACYGLLLLPLLRLQWIRESHRHRLPTWKLIAKNSRIP